jgi:predicted PurR-regulated permease PerM
MSEQRGTDRAQVSKAMSRLAGAAALALAIWVLGGLVDVLLLCFAGGLLALFLHGTGAWLAQRTKTRSQLMVGAFCVLLLGVAALTVWLAAPSVAAQLDELTTTLPQALEKASKPLEHFAWGRSVLARLRHPGDVLEHRAAWSRAGGVLSTTLGGLGGLFVVFFIGLFLAFDPDLYVRGFLRVVPGGRRAYVRRSLSLVSHTLQMWMIGKLGSMSIVGIGTWLGLALLEIPLATLLAVAAAILTFIPNFGPVVSAAPAILLAFLQGPVKALWVLGLYLGIQTVESYLLTPLLQKKTVDLPPALTLVAQVVMGTLAGGLGLIVATPLSAAVLALIKQAHAEDVRSDESSDPSTDVAP